jgi:DNA-directed RNA polymerase II subunit RPB1
MSLRFFCRLGRAIFAARVGFRGGFFGGGVRSRLANQLTTVTKLTPNEYAGLTMAAEFLVTQLPPTSIANSRIGMLGLNDLERLAVCQCTVVNRREGHTWMAYDPREGTIDDPRMGTLSFDTICGTCKQNNITCPGHLGFIHLPTKFIHPLLRKVACYLLNIFCYCCGSPKYDAYDLQLVAGLALLSKLKELSAICAKKSKVSLAELHITCPRSGEILMSAVAEGREDYAPDIFWMKLGKDQFEPITADDTLQALNRISAVASESLRELGWESNDLSGLILQALPVLPPNARPFGMLNGEMTIDPLTEKYIRILDTVKKSSDQLDPRKSRNELYVNIVDLFGEIQEKVKGKDGIIRGLSMGKRVDFSGRSVLGPYNKLQFGYIACPSYMRQVHTRPVAVSEFNLKAMIDFYRKGQVVNIIIGSPAERLSHQRIKVDAKMQSKYLPRVGDTVELMGMDGDEILFNRQPTLDKLSIMGYKVKYIEDPNYLCVGLHSSYTTPHNADFDGDEGNIHKIQGLDARSESRHMANVDACIMNA